MRYHKKCDTRSIIIYKVKVEIIGNRNQKKKQNENDNTKKIIVI